MLDKIDTMSDPEAERVISAIQRQAVGVLFTDTTPTSTTVPEGKIVVFDDGTTREVYVRTGKDTVAKWSISESTPASVVPIGTMFPYGGASAPTGFLLCDGSEVSQTTYADLYAVVGHSFGTDPANGNFILPDMRGRFPLGKDNMGGSSANRIDSDEADAVGGVDGDKEIGEHTHEDSTLAGDNSGGFQYVVSMSGVSGGAADGNVPPYQTFNYIIKT